MYKEDIYRRFNIYTRLITKLSIYYIKPLPPFENGRFIISSPVSTL